MQRPVEQQLGVRVAGVGAPLAAEPAGLGRRPHREPAALQVLRQLLRDHKGRPALRAADPVLGVAQPQVLLQQQEVGEHGAAALAAPPQPPVLHFAQARVPVKG